MKLYLLNTLAAAIACSSLNFIVKSEAENVKEPANEAAILTDTELENSEEGPKLKGPMRRYDEDGGIYQGPVYRDCDGTNYFNNNGGGTYGDPQWVGVEGRIKGTLFTKVSWFLWWQTKVNDEDWYIFTNPSTANYSFTFDGDSSYGCDIYEYAYDLPQASFSDYTELLWHSNQSQRSKTIRLLPGSYYIRIYDMYGVDIDSSKEYTLDYFRVGVHKTEFSFSEYTESIANRKEVILWENDLIPTNVDRWGSASQHIYTKTQGPYVGCLDPIFRDEYGYAVDQYNVDSWMYIFDRTYLKEIADNCQRLKDYLVGLSNTQLKNLRLEKAQKITDDATGALWFIWDVIGTFAPGYVGTGMGVISLAGNGIPAGIQCFKDFFHPDLDDTYPFNPPATMANLETLRQNCIEALTDKTHELGIRIPRFSKLQTEYSYNRTYWLASGFEQQEEKKYADNDIHQVHNIFYLISKSDIASSELDYTDYTGEVHHCQGTFSYYKDMDDFYAKHPFTLGSDVYENNDDQFDNSLKPDRTLQSISLAGNYRTTFLAGEQFDSSGLIVRKKDTFGFKQDIVFGNTAPQFTSDGKYLVHGVDASRVDMTKEGRYPVVVAFEEGDITKYAHYYIDVKWQRTTQYSYSCVTIYGDDMEYYTGHGTEWYYIDFTVDFPAEIERSEWDTVEYLGYELCDGNLDVFDMNIAPDSYSGQFNVHIKTRDNTGFRTIAFDYSYKAIAPLEVKPVLESISLSGEYATCFKLGQQFNTNGLIVNAHYSDGTETDVTSKCNISSNVDTSYLGEYTVNISYTESIITKTTSYTVLVRSLHLSSISLSGEYQTEFEYGESFNSSGLIVTANYANGEQAFVSAFEIDSDDYDSYCPGYHIIYVKYVENNVLKTTEYYVSVGDPKLTSIEISNEPQIYFEVGDEFNSNGLEIVANYENGSSQTMTEGFDVSLENVNMNQPGQYSVAVSYEENGIIKNVSYDIFVEEPEPITVLESITLSGNYKTVFENGESFSCSGLVVNAHYSDGTSREVYDYQVNDNFVRMNVPGRYTVFISYSENGVEVSASYVIRVKPRKYAEQELTSITLSGKFQQIFSRGEAFSCEGLIVTAHYSDGTEKEIKNYTVDTSNINFKMPGVYDVVVSYTEGGVTATATYSICITKIKLPYEKTERIEAEEIDFDLFPIFRP